MNFKKRIKINFDKQEFVSNIVINLILLNFLAGDFYVKKPRHKRLSFQLNISLVNVTKCASNWGFGNSN